VNCKTKDKELVEGEEERVSRHQIQIFCPKNSSPLVAFQCRQVSWQYHNDQGNEFEHELPTLAKGV